MMSRKYCDWKPSRTTRNRLRVLESWYTSSGGTRQPTASPRDSAASVTVGPTSTAACIAMRSALARDATFMTPDANTTVTAITPIHRPKSSGARHASVVRSRPSPYRRP